MQQPPNQPGEEQYLGLTAGQLNAAFLGVIGLIAVGVCAWLFLLGGLDTVTGKKNTDADTAFAAQTAANQAVLKLTDLPEGWKARAANSSDDSGDEEIDFELSQGCKVLEYDTLEIAKADSDTLYGPAKQMVSSDASVFTGDAAALDAFGVFANSWNTCREEITNAFRQAVLTSATEDGIDPNSFTVAFEPVPAPAVGDANGSMYRLFMSFVVEGQTVGFTIDFLSIRHGRMLAGFSYTAINATPDAAEEQQLAGLAAAKLVAAEASIPDA